MAHHRLIDAIGISGMDGSPDCVHRACRSASGTYDMHEDARVRVDWPRMSLTLFRLHKISFSGLCAGVFWTKDVYLFLLDPQREHFRL